MVLMQITELTMNFGGVVAVNDFSLDIGRGEIVGLIGPNGSGKTTVFNCISRLYQPVSGHIFMNGRDLLRLQPHQIVGTGIARTFQNIQLYNNLTVLDNIRISQHSMMNAGVISGALWLKNCREDEQQSIERARHVIEFLKLEGLTNTLAGSLPLGTQKVVELARAIVTNPKLLLLDEPVAGINTKQAAELGQLLLRIREEMGVAVLLIEHAMEFVMGICDRLCAINFGTKVTEGPPREVAENKQVIEAYLGQV
jgi:branched-chain amino acid transport system ATP-binding protein